ncbi:hypothetical protein GOP47_0004459 [Adiantum capillus-veneris]|uniref:Uncharacterized protein n=1 Tax=Adiantum capillus-veneris TaxID=13818 RepID=A0A9D4V8Q2_ADICA|nr:hypothetical protein GOP47_0004459 [Adiantum capillus-veneris]
MADRGLSDLLSTASTLLNSSQSHSSSASHGTGHAQKPPSAEQGNVKPSSSASHSHKPSYGEVMSSAQVVMNAAKTKLHKPSSTDNSSASEDVSMGKLAGAAGTLIGAVSHYGKLEESGYGKYAHKAQEYLHSYEIKHGKPGTQPAPPQGAPYHATAEPYGSGQGHSSYTSAPAAGYGNQPSAPYPPPGYPDAQQSYGYGHQGPSKPYASAGNEPPIGYPPPGYPTSGGSYNKPSK